MCAYERTVEGSQVDAHSTNQEPCFQTVQSPMEHVPSTYMGPDNKSINNIMYEVSSVWLGCLTKENWAFLLIFRYSTETR